MNILIDELPKGVYIDNIPYSINTDFRVSILFSMIIDDKEINDNLKFNKIIELYYPEKPHDLNKAFEIIMWFYRCGKEVDNKNNNKSNNIILDYEIDANYIYSAFMSQYKIDLQDIEYLHWWKFRALFDNLTEDNRIVEIMKYRSVDLSKIKDKSEKDFYKKMKDLYKIEKEEEINEADKEALKEMRKKLGV